MNRKINPLPFILFFLIFVLFQAYAFSGISFLLPAPWTRYLFWSILVAITFLLIQAIRRLPKYGPDRFFLVIAHIFLILIVSELAFVAVLLIGDTYRLFKGEYLYL